MLSAHLSSAPRRSEFGRGFTVLELLAVIFVISVLAGLLMASVRWTQDEDRMEQMLRVLSLDLQAASAMAQTDQNSVYLAVAAPGGQPGEMAGRGWCLLRLAPEPLQLQEWRTLPAEWAFALFPDPLQHLENFPAIPPWETGGLLLLAEAMPDGRFRTSEGLEVEAFEIRKGEWFALTSGEWAFDADERQLRGMGVELRPRSGVVQVRERFW